MSLPADLDPRRLVIVGNKLYYPCAACGKLVRINGFLGGLHFCVEQRS